MCVLTQNFVSLQGNFEVKIKNYIIKELKN